MENKTTSCLKNKTEKKKKEAFVPRPLFSWEKTAVFAGVFLFLLAAGFGIAKADVDVEPPAVTLTSPGTGEATSGMVSLAATATDDTWVEGVRFYINNTQVGSEDTSSPYSLSYDTGALADGSYTAFAVARDSVNSYATSSPVSFSVNHGASLVGWWKFDTNGDLGDYSGQNHHATGTGGATWTASGKFSGAYHFDGSQYLTIPDAPDFDVSTFSFSAWLQNEDASLFWNRIVSKKINYTDSNGWELSLETGTSNRLLVGGSNGTFTYYNCANFVAGGWHHVVAVFSGSTASVYCNGAFVSSSTIASVAANGNPLLLGKISGEPNTLWLGKIDDVRIYNRAVSAGEVSRLYSADSSAPAVGLSSPAAGAALSGTVTLTATSTDDTAVAGVKFFADNIQIGSEIIATSSPNTYSQTWDTAGVSNASHTLVAVARDAAGNVATSSGISITVDNSVPDFSALTASSTLGGAVITWTSSALSSSQVNFGTTSAYGSSTPETDTSPRVSSHSVVLSGLSACARYYFQAQSRNSALLVATSTGGSFITLGCAAEVSQGGGLPMEAFLLPQAPAGGFALSINRGAAFSPSRVVSLAFSAGNDIAKMAISNTGDFSDAGQEDFQPEKSWDLCSSFSGSLKKTGCPDGEYAVYVKYYTRWGQASPAVFDSVALKSGFQQVPAAGAFSRNLKTGMAGEDVRRLQAFLNSQGFFVAKTGPGSLGNETDRFGAGTRKALALFQEAYADQILKPQGLKKGTGLFYPATRKVVNALAK